MPARTIHLLCGPSGAGKTTVARRIAGETCAVRLSIDDCMKPLAIPANPDLTYVPVVIEKAKICATRVLQQAALLLAQNNDIVLDIATFRRVDRDNVGFWANERGARVVLYHVWASPATRRSRVLSRNEKKGETYSFIIPVWWFELAESFFQPPTADESPVLIDNEAYLPIA